MDQVGDGHLPEGVELKYRWNHDPKTGRVGLSIYIKETNLFVVQLVFEPDEAYDALMFLLEVRTWQAYPEGDNKHG